MILRNLGVPALLMVAIQVQAATCYELRSLTNDGIQLRFSGAVESTPFRGGFDVFEVRACLPEGDFQNAEIMVIVATGSASVGNRDGNQALRGSDFFGIDEFPEAEWRSTGIEQTDQGWHANGLLSIKGITAEQAVKLSTEVSQNTLQLAGSAEVERLTWGVGIGEFADESFIRNRVNLQFDLMLTRVDP